MTYVLIDFENVQTKSLEQLNRDDFKVIVFVGARQAISSEMKESLQARGSRAECIKISGQGPNALDFHIAYYIGRYAAAEPSAYFYIISKDKGFDPLIQHLKSKKMSAGRVKSIAEIPGLKPLHCKSPPEH